MSYFGGVGEEGGVCLVTAFNMLFVDNWRGKREGMMEIDYDKVYGTVGTKRKKKLHFYAHFTHDTFFFLVSRNFENKVAH